MGCKTSKEPHVDDDHFRRRRARAKHLALAVCDLNLDECPPSLKQVPRGPVIADGTAPRTPAVTPQAEEGRCSEPRRAAGAKGTRPQAHVDASNHQQDHQQTEQEQAILISPGVRPSPRARRGPPARKASTEASRRDVDEGGKAENHSCRENTTGECEEPEGYGTEDDDVSLQEPQQQQQQQQQQLPERKPPEEEESERAAWPAPPPVLLVLHLFLENHRPPPSEGQPPPCRVRFPGGLAYEGRLRRREQQDQGREVPHGWGRIVFPVGGFYEGDWRGGVVHGKGALHLANGNCYFGSWVRGRKHGLGTYIHSDGSCHEGFYAEGRRSGVGTMHYASGAVYEGEFEAGRRHGVGRLALAAGGEEYDGDWVNDVPHGHGVHVDPAGGGERFEGSWCHGIRSGGGTLVQGWAEKEREQEQEERGGESGVVSSSSSSSSDVAWYSGTFSGGYPHGDGMMMYGSMRYCGHVERGVWSGGGRVDLGEPGLGSFEGSWLDGIPRGGGRWQGNQSRVEEDCTFEQGYSGPTRPE